MHCVDFDTLVALAFTSRSFIGVAQTNAGVLAERRRMRLNVEHNKVVLYDNKTRLDLRYDSNMPFTYVAAMRRVASHVGSHSITALFIATDWRLLPMHRLLYAAPAIRCIDAMHISVAELNSASITSVDDVNRFTQQFPRLRRLCLGADGKPSFDWPAFLRSDGALKLPELLAGLLSNFSTETHGASLLPSELDFLEYCFDWTRLAEGFLETSLKRIAEADRTVTVQFRMSEEPNLSTDKFSVDVMDEYGRPIRHYKSRNSSISVYKQQGSFTVTNDPSFDLFDIVS